MKKIIYFLPLLMLFALATATPLRSGLLREPLHVNACSLPELEETYPIEQSKYPVTMFKF